MTIYIGIDPGAQGGVARLGNRIEPMAWKMPSTEGDICELFDELLAVKLNNDYEKVVCYIENVHSMPKQGVVSSFTFGKNYGFLRGVLYSYYIPFEEVTPNKWQKFLGCQSHGNKNVTKAKAQSLFPTLKITHYIADALLIAEYAKRVHVEVRRI